MRKGTRRSSPAKSPGKRLLAIREQLRLSSRDVAAESNRIAVEFHDSRFAISFSRVYDLEEDRYAPSIFRLYTFSRIYRRSMRELLGWYGVPFR